MLHTVTSELIRFQTEAGKIEEFKKVYAYIESLLPKDFFCFEYIEHTGILSQVIFLQGQDWKKARLLLCGHIDVIPAEPSQYEPRIEDGKIFGRGSIDMKSGIAAMVLAFKSIVESGGFPSVALLITGDEEIGGENGAGYISQNFELKPEFVLVPDGPRVDRMEITNQEKGLLWLKLEANGVAAHGSRPWLGKNAVDLLIDTINHLKEHFGVDNTQGWKTTISLNKLSTDNQVTNKIPDRAEAVLDIRFTEEHGLTPHDFFANIQRQLPSEIAATVISSTAPVSTSKSLTQLQQLQKIASDVAGEEIGVGYSDASHDASFFAAKGFPTALIGPVGGNWHGKNEWADLKTMEMLEQILIKYMQAFV